MLKYGLNNDPRAKEALYNLTRGLNLIDKMSELQPVKEWLDSEACRLAFLSCEESDEKAMIRMQGAATAITDLLKKIGNAANVRDTLKNS